MEFFDYLTPGTQSVIFTSKHNVVINLRTKRCGPQWVSDVRGNDNVVIVLHELAPFPIELRVVPA